MITADISQRIDSLASQIDRYDLSAASRLRQLSRALGYGELAEEWAAIDIYRLIDPSDIIEQVRAQAAGNRWLNLIELVRNVLLLVPIAVTWFGVTQAVDGYYTLLTARPDLAQQPFIYLWQDGFGGHTWPTLGQLGLLNAALLGVVIALTLVALSWAARLETVQEQRAEALRRELSEVLAIASLHLQTVSRRTPTSLIEHVRNVSQQLIGELAAERTRITELAERRDREVSVLHQFSADLRLGANELLEAARLTGAMSRDLAGHVGSLTPSIAQMAAAANQLVTVGTQVAAPLSQTLAVQSQIGGQIGAAAHAMQQAVATLDKAAEGTRGASEELIRTQRAFVTDLQEQRTAQASLAETVGQSATSLTQIGHVLQQLTGGLAANLSALTPSARAMAEHGDALLAATRTLEESARTLAVEQKASADRFTELRGIQESLRDTTQTLDRAVTLFERTAQYQDGFLAALRDERTAQADLARMVSAGTVEFESLAESIRQAAVSLHAIAVDLSELRDAQPRFSNNREP